MKRQIALDAHGRFLQISRALDAPKWATPFRDNSWWRGVDSGRVGFDLNLGHSPEFGDIQISFCRRKADRYPLEFQREPNGIQM
jgi:hypothetical protein